MIRTNDDPENPETRLERALYHAALVELARHDPVAWQYAAKIYIDYEYATQDWRIREWKKLAARGLPSATELLAKVAELRMMQ